MKIFFNKNSFNNANREAVLTKTNPTSSRKMIVVSSSNIKTASIKIKAVKKKKIKNFTHRKMLLISKTKVLQKKKMLRVLYAVYCVQIAGQNFYYPNRPDFSSEFSRATIEMAQVYYPDYMRTYLVKSLGELSFFTKNGVDYNNYVTENIEPFVGHPEIVPWNFALVMFEDRFNILRSPGYDPLDWNGSEMLALLTKYRVQVDPDYQVTRELLNLVSGDLLRDSDLALCALVLSNGSISNFVFGLEPGSDHQLVLSKFCTFRNYLQEIEYNYPFAADLSELIIPNFVSTANLGEIAVMLIAYTLPVAAEFANTVGDTLPAAAEFANTVGDTVPAAAEFAATVGDTVPAANYVPSASVPLVDSLPIPTIDLDPTPTDTGSNNNNSGSPNSGFPFYSCIFGVLLVGVLIKTFFF